MSESTTNAKRMPGPWVVECPSDARKAVVIRTATPVHSGATVGVELAKVTRLNGYTSSHAHLFAAAPDLLAACEATVEYLHAVAELTGSPTPMHLYEGMRAAIAKATNK